MNLILRGRGIELNERLREYASSKLTRSERLFERIMKMDVEFSEEHNPRVKLRHRVEVTVTTPGETLRAHGAAVDYFAAIDQAADRLERQLRRFKSRRTDHHKGGNNHGAKGSIALKSQTPPGPAIVRAVAPDLKPMTPAEAVIELESRELPFLLYRSADTMEAVVLHRALDGTYELVELPG